LTFALIFEGGGRVMEDVRTEEGAESSRRACAHMPSSQLEIKFSRGPHKLLVKRTNLLCHVAKSEKAQITTATEGVTNSILCISKTLS